MSLELSEDLMNEIRRHGEAAYPAECCGVLAGTVDGETKSVVRLVPLVNRRDDDPHRYLITADDLRRVDGELRRDGLDIVGYYHSHPDHPAAPSAFDTAHAWPWYSYVIVRVAGGQGAELASWVLDDDEVQPVMRPESLDVRREV